MSQERTGLITFQGAPLTLVGPELSLGQPAPDATLLTTELKEQSLLSLPGKATLLVTVPSLDTSVCSLESKRFNDEAAKIEGASVVVASMDLPFAQARWAGENSIEHLTLFSDHREAALGLGYGLLIKELRLLARAIVLIGPTKTVDYVQLVSEVTDEPDYDAALAALTKAL